MKSFSEWPLDGLLGFTGIVAGLGLLLTASLFDRALPASVEKTDGLFPLPPKRSAFVLGGVLLLFTVITTYAVAQSGHCSSMTAAQNAQNQLIGILLAITFWLGWIWYVYSQLLARYAFNADEFVVQNPLKAPKKFAWKDLTDVGVKYGTPCFTFANRHRFYLPSMRRGVGQLKTLIDSKILHKTQPLAPIYADAASEFLIGKTVLVIEYRLNENGQAQEPQEWRGVIDRIDAQKLYIKTADGSIVEASASVRGLARYDEETYIAETEPEPDFVLVWYV